MSSRSRQTAGFNFRETNMPRGDKSAYTDKQKRKAGYIEDSYKKRGMSDAEAERRAWAIVNKIHGGGEKSGSGRGKPENKEPSRKGGKKGGKASAKRSKAAKSRSAKKAAKTRTTKKKTKTRKKKTKSKARKRKRS
jgi:hypothetical protein